MLYCNLPLVRTTLEANAMAHKPYNLRITFITRAVVMLFAAWLITPRLTAAELEIPMPHQICGWDCSPDTIGMASRVGRPRLRG